jgi:hypothetical protein
MSIPRPPSPKVSTVTGYRKIPQKSSNIAIEKKLFTARIWGGPLAEFFCFLIDISNKYRPKGVNSRT